MSEKIDCSWCVMRSLSLKPRPIKAAEWRAQVSKDSRMFAGKEIFLCSYHKKNVVLKFDKIEKLTIK